MPDLASRWQTADARPEAVNLRVARPWRPQRSGRSYSAGRDCWSVDTAIALTMSHGQSLRNAPDRVTRQGGSGQTPLPLSVAVTLRCRAPPDEQNARPKLRSVSRSLRRGSQTRPDAVACQSRSLASGQYGPIPLPPRCHEDQKGLTAILAIRPLTCTYLVAGTGFEPATSGL